MTIGDSLLDAQTTALLRRLGREQETRTRRARDEAEAQVRDILRRTRTEARARVHQAVLDQRREDETALARRRAAIETRLRRARQKTLRQLLDSAWAELPEALEERWGDTGDRLQWCRAACAQALRSLLKTDRIQVEIDSEWAEELGPVAMQHLTSHASSQVSIVRIDGLGAGLRVRAGEACLDATLGGLLAARERVTAELLAEVEQQFAARAGEAKP